ncbi:MAG: prolyl oligopeptidase family serine peptidase [Gemmatimonadetes bacterium]|nr:prolyl oligopeptidase family serine peptidase [Gemmatimonadota bacterium]
MADLAAALRARLALAPPPAAPVAVRRGESVDAPGYRRERLEYLGGDGDIIPAFLFTPRDGPPRGGVVVLHQHNGEFHFGKSEVAGLVGHPHQAFGPALAQRGVAVLAPDALSFEDRRGDVRGTAPDPFDWVRHYKALAYRVLDGDTLLRTALDDAQRALSVLREVTGVDARRLGIAGHSYGGYTALYLAAIDARAQFTCISGAVCSFATRRREDTNITLLETVPGLARDLETHDLLAAVATRPTLVVSARGDKYSRDADEVVARVPGGHITSLRVDGGHALDAERFDAIVTWLEAQAGRD